MFDSMLQLASSKSKELEAMLATAREVARASAEAEVMATWSKVNELEAQLATARREAREARQLALEEVRSPCELEQMLITARQEVRSPRMEAFAARSSNCDRPARDVMLDVRASLAKSQQLHADRMARIRQDYADGMARIRDSGAS